MKYSSSALSLVCCKQVLWIHLLWRLASHQLLLTHLLLVRRKRSRVVEFPLVSCSHLGQLVYQQLRQQSGQLWLLSTHPKLYHHSTATTHSCEADSAAVVCCKLHMFCSAVFLCCCNSDIISVITYCMNLSCESWFHSFCLLFTIVCISCMTEAISKVIKYRIYHCIISVAFHFEFLWYFCK